MLSEWSASRDLLNHSKSKSVIIIDGSDPVLVLEPILRLWIWLMKKGVIGMGKPIKGEEGKRSAEMDNPWKGVLDDGMGDAGVADGLGKIVDHVGGGGAIMRISVRILCTAST